MFETSLLENKRILVTGGGSGVGAAMGRRFLALSAELVICGRKLDRLEATAREMRDETGGKVTAIGAPASTASSPISPASWSRTAPPTSMTRWW